MDESKLPNGEKINSNWFNKEKFDYIENWMEYLELCHWQQINPFNGEHCKKFKEKYNYPYVSI